MVFSAGVVAFVVGGRFSVQVSDGGAGGGPWQTPLREEIRVRIPGVTRGRPFETPREGPHHEEPLTDLRDTVVRRVDDPPVDGVAEALGALHDQAQSRSVDTVRQACHILEKESLWPHPTQNIEIARDGLESVCVVERPGLVLAIETRLREGRARRATGKESDPLLADQVSQLALGDSRHWLADQGDAREVEGVAFAGEGIVVEGDERPETRPLQTEIEPAAAGEQAYGVQPAQVAARRSAAGAGSPPNVAATAAAIWAASLGGTALPICRTLSRREPAKR